ncbi:MAG: TolC family outer membrane protein [Mariprofundaceae bacterium]
MRAMFWLMLTLLACAGPARAEVLTLQDAVEQALARAPGFQAERVKRQVAAEDVRLARAWLLPYVEAGGGWGRFRQRIRYDHALPFPLADRLSGTRTTVQLRLVQALFRLDRWAAWREGKLGERMAETGLALARQALVLEVAARYSEAVAADAALEAAAQKRCAMEKAARMAEARMREGLGTKPEMLAARSRAALAEADWLAARQRRDLAYARLEAMIGERHPPLPAAMPAVRGPDGEAAVTPEAMAELAQRQALGVRLARLKQEMADEEVTRAWGGALPSIDLVAGISRERVTDGLFGSGSVQRNDSIGIEVRVPIFAGGGTWAQLRKSEKQRIEAGFRLEDARREAALGAREAWLGWQSALARRRSLEAAVDAAGSARDAAQRSWQEGLTDIVGLLDAESRLAEARAGLAAARAAELMARLRMDAAVGRLDAGRLPVREPDLR